MKALKKTGFTLVELLVVIGIITILIGILIPTLSKAREQANQVRCESNLRQIGQGITAYESANLGAIPASVLFGGMILRGGQQYGPLGTQTSADIWGQGYINWTAAIFSGKVSPINDPIYSQPTGWEIFQCPDLPNGGVAPANTFAGNNDWPAKNEAPQINGVPAVDAQAPRLSYMLNEALSPRGRFGKGVPSKTVATPYHYVIAGHVRNSAGTILATENWGQQSLMLTKDQITSAVTASNSRRPVSGVSVPESLANGANGVGGVLSANPSAENLYTAANPGAFVNATVSDILPDPSAGSNWTLGNITTTLDFVGRNHGRKVLGNIAGPNGIVIHGWDLRTSNFLYLDGHVENKNISQTVGPNGNEWGDKFYTLLP